MLTEKNKPEKNDRTNKLVDNLYKDYVDDLYAYAMGFGFDKQTAMDAIHDVFYKICLHEENLEAIKNPKFYLLRTLRNRLIDLCRLNKGFTEVQYENISDELPYKIKVTIEDELIAEEERQCIALKIEGILGNLSNHQREIIYLRYMQECSYEEISTIMQLSIPACRKLVYRTLTKLKEEHTLLLFYLWASINIS